MSKELLDRQFINLLSTRLEGFAWKSAHTANCRCPLCGDSKDVKKRRGYFISGKSGREGFCFTCHNCGRSVSVLSLLKAIAPDLAGQYGLNSIRNGRGEMIGDTFAKTMVSTPKPKPVVSKKTSPKSPSLMVSIASLPNFHPAYRYIVKRGIPKKFWTKLFYTKDYGLLVKALTGEEVDMHDERIVIPFYTADGKPIACQGRSMDPECMARYLTTKIDKTHPKIWGLNHVDLTKRVFVLEGPIKAMFIPNCVAMGGADIGEIDAVVPKDKRVFVYDNEPRAPEICDRMRNQIAAGERLVIWNRCPWPYKDVDDMICKGGATPSEVEQYMNAHTFSGISAKLEFSKWCSVLPKKKTYV